ncbi:hypothetical protein EYF80_016606 [Liparis tanakae]|uniref:Uncharacterized protein n=1 Tax=Liparis tanakae TaxID=230148 RepID=A0A4Z2I5M4_9TELE|nr:hypothetical protein EYF80_016606 [Liparis tanakae]
MCPPSRVYAHRLKTSRERAHQGHLAGLIAGSNPQLVDVRLGNVDSLLGVVQLVLDFPETHRAEAHLLLLVDAKNNIGQESTLELRFSPHLLTLDCSFSMSSCILSRVFLSSSDFRDTKRTHDMETRTHGTMEPWSPEDMNP